MKNQDELIIDGEKIAKGSRKRIEMKIAELYDHTDITMQVEIIRGNEDGPTMFISAAIHGDEINGVETISRLLNRKKLLSSIKGNLLIVPIVNVFGFNRNVRYLPDRRDLNRCFPGSNRGSLAAKIAHKFTTEIVDKSDYGIDLHTASIHRYNLPQIRAYLDNEEVKELAKSFGVPVIINSNFRDGSLRQTALERGVKTLLFEGGEANRYDEAVIRSAEQGVIAVLSSLNMLDKKQVKIKPLRAKEIYYAKASHWIRAPKSGSLRIRKNIGNKVDKGEVIGVISDPFGEKKEYIRAKREGVIIGITKIPLVNSGDALFHIATFTDDPMMIENEVMRYDQELH
ncbi:MAG: succinylglutamate desuccinylase/aspartoacylase family protein [Rickettsiaceae bacterium]|nr:succinylglutamate desuccinylase/aspartoacylase family protein [Rickettsiaceae bacterium]